MSQRHGENKRVVGEEPVGGFPAGRHLPRRQRCTQAAKGCVVAPSSMQTRGSPGTYGTKLICDHLWQGLNGLVDSMGRW